MLTPTGPRTSTMFENDTFLFFDDNLELIEALPGTSSFEFRVLNSREQESLTNEDVRLMLTIELRLTRSTSTRPLAFPSHVS